MGWLFLKKKKLLIKKIKRYDPAAVEGTSEVVSQLNLNEQRMHDLFGSEDKAERFLYLLNSPLPEENWRKGGCKGLCSTTSLFAKLNMFKDETKLGDSFENHFPKYADLLCSVQNLIDCPINEQHFCVLEF